MRPAEAGRGMPSERLQKLIARAGLTSRRGAEDLIRRGRVTVNGRVASLGDRADPEEDAIRVDGKPLPEAVRPLYLLLNKPDGVMTTRNDPAGRPTVFDLVPARLHRGLHTVGRLDFHSEGLLLLTTDGEFAHRVAHPSHGCRKTYEVKVKGAPSSEALAELRSGVVVDGRRVAPVELRPLKVKGRRPSRRNTWWTLVLSEGRTRQIREMFFRVGHPVQRLRRVAIGRLSDARLRPGEYRELTPGEVEDLAGSIGAQKGGG